MQKDHGFNPPPVWTILGRGVGELHGATTGHLQLLAALDLALAHLAGMFAALFRAFGWCVLTVSMGIARASGSSSSACSRSSPVIVTRS
jgi:hypothetical protein